MPGIHFKKVVIIGVGLIGGSLAIVLRNKGLASNIVGLGRGINNLEAARRLGIIDSFTLDYEEGIEGADLVVIATPVLKIADTVKQARPYLKKGCIITDVGSVKGAVIEEVEAIMPDGAHFVPGHPIAGTEHSGAEAAFAELFIDRKCILTPTEKTDRRALETVKKVWEAAGSNVAVMDAGTHDRILAAVSHLPHMIAYSLVNTVADIEDEGIDALTFSAGGFRDFTRIASSSPEMWTDICAMNGEALIDTIEGFQKRLEQLKSQIKGGELEKIRKDFERAKLVRDSLLVKQAKA